MPTGMSGPKSEKMLEIPCAQQIVDVETTARVHTAGQSLASASWAHAATFLGGFHSPHSSSSRSSPRTPVLPSDRADECDILLDNTLETGSMICNPKLRSIYTSARGSRARGNLVTLRPRGCPSCMATCHPTRSYLLLFNSKHVETRYRDVPSASHGL
jgi:hypothetical protein